MFNIGIDVGSTYTKYAVIDDNGMINSLLTEKTPIHQKEYFDKKISELQRMYGKEISIVSCGYGKKNVEGINQINELTALARGAEYVYPGKSYVLDIGGQDTKIIRQERGNLKEFFLNDKCAAGSGMFLGNIVNMFGKTSQDISLVPYEKVDVKLDSTCAVFAQSEIIGLVADNVSDNMILSAVVCQIFSQARKLISKVNCDEIILSGGLSQIHGIEKYAEGILEIQCIVGKKNNYLSAIGCARKLERIYDDVIQ